MTGNLVTAVLGGCAVCFLCACRDAMRRRDDAPERLLLCAFGLAILAGFALAYEQQLGGGGMAMLGGLGLLAALVCVACVLVNGR